MLTRHQAPPRLLAIAWATCRTQDCQCGGENTRVAVGMTKLSTGFAENVVACSGE